MPVIFDRENDDLWLDPGMNDVGVVSEILLPYDARLMRSYAVSTRLNNVANDDSEYATLTQPTETQRQLFF